MMMMMMMMMKSCNVMPDLAQTTAGQASYSGSVQGYF